MSTPEINQVLAQMRLVAAQATQGLARLLPGRFSLRANTRYAESRVIFHDRRLARLLYETSR